VQRFRKIHASIEVVVVLPCVPATTRTFLPTRNSSCRICGSEQNGMRSSSKRPVRHCRAKCVAYDYEIGRGLRFVAAKAARPECPGIRETSTSADRKPRPSSDAETALLQHAASDAIAVPQIPMR